MSDRVRFLCDNGMAGVGYSGCNGFPFAYSSATPGTLNPVKFSFQDCIKQWWRVKNWHLQTDCAIVDTLGNPYALPSEDLTRVPGGPTRELDLIQATTTHNWLNTTAGNWGLNWSIMRSGFDQIILSGADHYPDNNLDPGLTFVGSNPALGQLTLTFANPGGGIPSFTATIDGTNIPIYYDAVSAPPTSFTASQFDLTPVEYWPYKGLNGNPIYNTSTGAQLQSPLA